ncbi:MAG: hypothetical protein AAF740_00075 [Bacteroidota bacterium]
MQGQSQELTLSYPSVRQVLLGYYPQHSLQYEEWLRTQYEVLMTEKSDSLPVYMELEGILHRLTLTDSAKAVLHQAQEKFPESTKVWHTHAWREFEQETFPAALETFFRAVELDTLNMLSDTDLEQRMFEYAAIQFPIEDLKRPLQGEIGIDDLKKKRTLKQLSNFYHFIKTDWKKDQQRQLDRTIIRLTRILHTKNPNSRLPYEMLGDLLLAKGTGELAALAYLRAGQFLKNEAKRRMYRYLATQALLISQKYKTSFSTGRLIEVSDSLQSRARLYHQEIDKNEKFWIESGANPVLEFQKKYLKPFAILDTLPESREEEMILVYREGISFSDFLIVDGIYEEKYRLSLDTLPEPEELEPESEATATFKIGKVQWILLSVLFLNTILVVFLFRKYGHQPSTSDHETTPP